MSYDRKLEVDEEERIAQQEQVKGAVRGELKSEVVRSASRADSEDRAGVEELGQKFRQKALSEVAVTDAEIERARGIARISQVIDYFFYLIYGIIALDVTLDLLGARESSGFKRLLDALASPLLSPFRGLLSEPSRGQFHLRLSYIF